LQLSVLAEGETDDRSAPSYSSSCTGGELFVLRFATMATQMSKKRKVKIIFPAAMILVVPRCVIWGLLLLVAGGGFFWGGGFSFVHLVALLCQVLSWILLVHALDLMKLVRKIEEQILALVRNPLNRNCEGNSYW
jgi:hypothetical protein